MKMDNGKKPSCYNCAHCDADIDMDAFCTHPSIEKEFPWGKVLHASVEHCLKDGKLTLHERHR